MDNILLPLTTLFMIMSLMDVVMCQKDKSLYCEVCKVVVDELEWEISKVDPKKVIEVDSFRVDPTGRQSYTRKIPYARSEAHLIDLVENTCDKMKQYAESTDPKTGKKTYIRTSSRDGEAVTLSNASISGEVADKLKNACENVIGEHDEEIIEVLKKEDKNTQQRVCRDVLGLCSEEENRDEL